ncbi:GNAT family N-acetyltransferase [Faunimonas sp. B44]|uniref:GNAT family N-acetyltransferase n=1 Tax=Faunimonas sp. B44 TaxID=3461493 RepID=UPI004043B671
MARPSDLDAVHRIETGAFETDRLSRRSMARLLASGSARCLVAEHRGEVVGYVLVLLRRTSAAARLYSLAVDPRASGTGLGHLLLCAAERAARDAGKRTLRLEVRTDNRRAIRLYEAAGYRPIGTRDDYYEDGAAALRYERALSPDSLTAPKAAAA